jgi:hypothetical protein
MEPRLGRSESAAAHEALIALRYPDGRVHFAGDYTTNMSSRIQERLSQRTKSPQRSIRERACR